MFGFVHEVVQEDMKELLERNIPFELLKGKAVLITGANGMLATYMIYLLMYLNFYKDYSIKVIALTRNETKASERFAEFIENPLFELLIQDVCNPIDIKHPLDYIIHAAGNASPKYILSDPVGIIKANIAGTMNIIELARKHNVKKVLYTSTREVYGKMPENIDKIEETDCGNLNFMEVRACYPESKRMAETLLISAAYQYGINFNSARIAHAYGPGMEIYNDGRVMADFISDIVSKRDIVLKSKGDALRAFCYITDAVTALFLVLLKGENSAAYNISNETEEISVADLAKMMTELYKEQGNKVIFDIPKEQSIAYSKMGRTKLGTERVEDLGWSCRVMLSHGIKKTVSCYV